MGINNPGGTFADISKFHDETLSATGSFDVLSIPADFSVMELFMFGRSTVAATSDETYIFYNGDTTQTNYRRRTNNLDAAYATSVGDNAFVMEVTAASSPANYFSGYRMLVLNYNGSTTKIGTFIGGIRRELTPEILSTMGTLHWEDTAAINQVTWQTDGGDDFAIGSRLQIWLYI